MIDHTALFVPPPSTPMNYLSLGAGVQSSALALLAALEEVGPMPDAAFFADTAAEPLSVYRWLEWLEKQLPFPVIRVGAGNLTATSTTIRTSKKTGDAYLSHNVPAYTRNSDGGAGNWRRQCTEKHKLLPLARAIDQHRAGRPATVWIGISWDELQRMKESTRRGVVHRWPLLERRWTRKHCVDWMAAKGFPAAPRSACVYCPYHSKKEWRRLRDEEPAEFARAVAYERQLQEQAAKVPRLDGVPFLHASRVPLSQVDLSTDAERGQGSLFDNECAGICGV